MEGPSEKETILGIETQLLVRWGLILLLCIIALSSLIDGGALSNDYQKSPMMVLLPLVLLGYMIIVTALIISGLNPNKFELIFIPFLIIMIIVVSLSLTNMLDNVIEQSDPGIGTNSDLDSPTTNQVITTGDGNPDTNPRNTQNQIETQDNSPDFSSLQQTISIIISIIGFLALIGGILYYFLSRDEFDPNIQVARIEEYAKSEFETNKSIIEYYTEASMAIERLKGKAPEWFSPTFFSEHVEKSPGPPLSSYFDRLTFMYELARFSHKEMTENDVQEAKSLNKQIVNMVHDILTKLKEEEVQEV